MQPTWDLFIIIIFGVFTAYGFFMGKNRILGILVNFYIALAVTMVTGELLYTFASRFALISNNLTASLFGTKVILLAVITGLLVFKSETAGLDTGSSLSKVQTGLYGFLTAGIVLSTVFSFMTGAQVMALESNFAILVGGYYPIWVGAPVLLMIGSNILKR